MKSWLNISNKHDFSIHNIPFGVFYTEGNKNTARCGTILGDNVIDLKTLFELGYFLPIPQLTENYFKEKSLNNFLSLGNEVCYRVRRHIQNLFLEENTEIKSEHRNKIIFNVNQVENLLPIQVGDYVDFYSSIEHATNVGKMFRDETNPLLPNWKYIPIGYHGRSSSIVVSGTPFKRPKGQIRPNDAEPPFYGLCRHLDFELEMAFITNKTTQMGETISPNDAENYIFGLALLNDWSARDIQKWEYVPLGPFLGKSFATSLSPWIVSLDALKDFALEGEKKDLEELDYLKCSKKGLYDIKLEAYIQSAKMQEPFKICDTNYKNMYWNLFQQLAHMSSNGTPIRVGDLYGSGTISGKNSNSYGSMLELCWKGTKPILLPDGTTRTFLQDGDTVIFRGYCEKGDVHVGFGEVRGTILS